MLDETKNRAKEAVAESNLIKLQGDLRSKRDGSGNKASRDETEGLKALKAFLVKEGVIPANTPDCTALYHFKEWMEVCYQKKIDKSANICSVNVSDLFKAAT